MSVVRVALRRHKLIGERGTLLDGKLVQRLFVSIFVLDDRRTGVIARAVDDELAESVNVVVCDGFREGELAREDGWYADLIWLDVGVGRDDGTSGVVDTLALLQSQQELNIAGISYSPSCAYGTDPPSARGPASHQEEVASLVASAPGSCCCP